MEIHVKQRGAPLEDKIQLDGGNAEINVPIKATLINSFLASGNFCLLITFANSLNLDQDRQIICPDLDPNHLTLRLSADSTSRQSVKHLNSHVGYVPWALG